MTTHSNEDLGVLTFTDQNDIEDLKTMLRRLEVVGEPEIVLVKQNKLLSVFGCTQNSGGLLSRSNTVLVHRAYLLEEETSKETDEEQRKVVTPLRAMLDRIARLNSLETSFSAPTSSLFTSWAGLMPSRAGWLKAGDIDAESLKKVAKQGMARVSDLLPEDAGAPVLDRVRRSVWDLEIAPAVPAAAAFALETLGFLEGAKSVKLYKRDPWVRLSTEHGDVLVKTVRS